MGATLSFPSYIYMVRIKKKILFHEELDNDILCCARSMTKIVM